MTISDNLNAQQKKAVTFGEGPLLIVAGAGTGKTTVITQRIAWLVMEKKIKTDEILALTFTEKAAAEMEERIDVLLPYGYVDLWVSTFHSFCERILKDNALEIGLPPDFKLLSETDQVLLIRQNLDKFDLDYYRPLGNPGKFIQALVRHFSRAKDENIQPEEYIDYAQNLQMDRDKVEYMGKKDADDDEISEDKRIQEVANAYHVYQQLLLDNSALDFGDLIIYAIKLFKTRPKVLAKYQEQFKYILVDEFQDTNYAQYELIKLLAGKQANLTVVGDDDQCLPANAKIQLSDKQKTIDKIKIGDEVQTGVGKGHVGLATVSKIFQKTKQTSLVTLTTQSGQKITTTGHHKMFCYVPSISDKKYYYVYLMFRRGLGWRIGVTNDLCGRLRLERSADKIIGLCAYGTETEARYWETFYSLKYGLPTVCFQKRKGVAIVEDWLKKLYAEIDTEYAVRKLALDLGIDLHAHHCLLQGVVRGGKSRVNIYFNMNYRNYRSKEHVRKNHQLIGNPKISHLVFLETSDLGTIKKLKKAGYSPLKAKKGWRMRIQVGDIREAGLLVKKLQQLTDAEVENRFAVGRINYQHRPALLMPAGNVLPGHFLPVKKGNNIEYEMVKQKSVTFKKLKVYDLELAKTHNFIADGIVVHNSVYKFRGAAISNILEFKKDFPKSEEIVLTENYRTKQNILDLAYKFIKQNDPNRLEYQLSKKDVGPKGSVLDKKISKELKSQVGKEGVIQHLHFKSYLEEANGVVKKIIELKKSAKGGSASGGKNTLNWSDFAILVRANSYSNEFINALSRLDIPYQFLASKGLYAQPEIMDVISYLKLLDNYHESASMWRVLNLKQFKLPTEYLMTLSRFAYMKRISLYEATQQVRVIKGLSTAGNTIVEKLLGMIERHTQLAKEKSTLSVALAFMRDAGYYKMLTKKDSPENFEKIIHLNQFFRKIEDFESANDDRTVKQFLTQLEEEQEAGEAGSMQQPWEEGPDAVKIMTIHGAKGLEFPYVFMVSLVDKRFPSIERKEPIALPDELIKEIIPEGDIHLEEERRLFYVGMTRARDGLFFTSADDYGGARKKKPSRFLIETGFQVKKGTEDIDLTERFKAEPISQMEIKELEFLQKAIPEKSSYSQLRAFNTCPKQFKYAHILKIPVEGRHTFSFGKSIHNTLFKFFTLVKERAGKKQESLFSAQGGMGDRQGGPSSGSGHSAVGLDELLGIYEAEWIEDWYLSKQHKEDYFQKGREALQGFYEAHAGKFPTPLYLEQPFHMKLGDYTFKGVIDRIDPVGSDKDTVEIIDYKTGQLPKNGKLSPEDREQLMIYNLAARDVLKLKPTQLTYYYIDKNKPISFTANDKDLDKLKKDLEDKVANIRKSDFHADPGFWCKTCDFRDICEDKWSG